MRDNDKQQNLMEASGARLILILRAQYNGDNFWEDVERVVKHEGKRMAAGMQECPSSESTVLVHWL
jgi:hypothetical protein